MAGGADFWDRETFLAELRAVGAGVRQDQAFLLVHSGFDTLEPPAGVDLEAVRRALSRYDVGYPPGSAQLPLRRQRFGLTQGVRASFVPQWLTRRLTNSGGTCICAPP